MHLDSVGKVLAERILELDAAGDRRKVRVLLGQPRTMPGSHDFFCPYQVVGLGDEVVRYAGGVDAAQAIYLAMEAVGTALAATREALSGALTWYGEPALGFPVRDQLPGLRLVASNS
jgi:hypothetical protein